MENEIWKDIKDFQGLYQISNLGRVKSLPRTYKLHGFITTKERILKFGITNKGYYYVNLSKNAKVNRQYVHRLVAQAFIPNPDNLLEVNHKDENPKNNNLENLEWCTHAYNNTYGTKIERMRQKKLGTHLSEEHKRKIGESSRGRLHTNEWKQKMSNDRKNRILIHKGYDNKYVYKDNLDYYVSLGYEIGANYSPEIKEKLSKSATKQWQNWRKEHKKWQEM